MRSKALHRSLSLFSLLMCTVSLGLAGLARAVTWGPPEAIESGVVEISSPAGTSAIWLADDWPPDGSVGAWHVVYPKNGGVGYAWRDSTGWHLGPMLAAEGSGARDPHLGLGGPLTAVWSADDGPTRAVFARRGVMQSWDAAEKISVEGVFSQAPVVSGGLVAWEDSIAVGFRVRGRYYTSPGWGPVEAISTADADAREPTVTDYADDSGLGSGLGVAWSDWRNGEPEIYLRLKGTAWEEEQRLTTLGPACRRPCLLVGGIDGPPWRIPVVAFEATGPEGGAAEIWIAPSGSAPSVLSSDDGVDSRGVNLAAFWKEYQRCNSMPGLATSSSAAWTDDVPSGSLLRSRGACAFWAPADSMASSMDTRIALGARPGTPTAALLQVWVEQVAGEPTIVAREGTTPGCYSEVLTASTPLILAPGGEPPMRLRSWNACGTEGIWTLVSLSIDQDLVGQLNLDSGQHPWMSGETDDDGWVEFPILGGGCAASGHADAEGGTFCHAFIQGAKSPDVNGDCVVGEDDRAYVLSRLGTDDFCADLDASGVVDSVDVAVVDATLGDECPGLAAVEDGIGSGEINEGVRAATLVAYPNPADRATRLTLRGSAGLTGPIELWIHDAAGREVRRLEMVSPARSASVAWDLRNSEGRPVPAGCYFAATRTAGGVRRTPVIVIR